MSALVKDMLTSVYNLNESGLSDKIETAFDLFPVQVVFADIIAPMMYEIGRMWERGELMVVMEHFASNVIITKLRALLNKYTTNSTGPVVIVGCATNEMHEIGSLMVAFFMSFNGWKVIYLGQNVPTPDLLNIVDTMEVHTIALSATTNKCLSSLKTVGAHIASRAKRKKIEFLVGGGLLRMGDGNVLETIPAATSRDANDLCSYYPPTHTIHQDTIVGGDIYGSYSFISESFRKMGLERRGHQITDDRDNNSVGTTIDKNNDLLEEPEEILGSVDLSYGKSLESVCVETSPNLTNNNKPNNTSTVISPVFNPNKSGTSSGSHKSWVDTSLKTRLEKQMQQTQAMKKNLKKYQDGTKAAEACIARSRAFLDEHGSSQNQPSLQKENQIE